MTSEHTLALKPAIFENPVDEDIIDEESEEVLTVAAVQAGLIGQIFRSLEDVVYHRLEKPIIIADPRPTDVVQFRVLSENEKFLVPPPDIVELGQIKELVVETIYGNLATNEEKQAVLDKMARLLAGPDLAKNPKYDPEYDIVRTGANIKCSSSERLKVFESLRRTEEFATKKCEAATNFLLTNCDPEKKFGNGFFKNGSRSAVVEIEFEGDSIVGLTLRPTDFLSYMTIAGCSESIDKRLRSDCGLAL